MSTYQQFFGRLTIGTSTDTIDLDDNGGHTDTVTVTSGSYYIAGHAGESAPSGRSGAQLVEEIEAVIQAGSGGYWSNVTCTWSTTTGKVSFTAGAADSIDITFTDGSLRTILGFSADITGLDDTAQEAANEAGYQWRPDRPLSQYPVARDLVWEPVSSTMCKRARDGTLFTMEGFLLYQAQLEWRWVAGDRVYIPASGSINQEFETLFKDVLHEGEYLRFYPDRSQNADSTDYVVCVVGDGEHDLGSFSDYAQRERHNNDSWWRVSLPLLKYVD